MRAARSAVALLTAAVTAALTAGCATTPAAAPPPPTHASRPGVQADAYAPPIWTKPPGVFTPGTLCRRAGTAGVTSDGVPMTCRGPDDHLQWVVERRQAPPVGPESP